MMRDFGGGDDGALQRASKARRRYSPPTNAMKLPSAPLEASAEAVSDNAEH